MILDHNQTNQTIEEPKFITACGGKVKDPSKYPSAEYHGKTIYFCTQACLNVFLLSPDPFMDGEIEHPLD